MKKCNLTFKYLLLSILFIFLLTGCWSSRSIEDLNIVVGSAVDKSKDGKIKSTLQYVIPEAIGNANSKSPQQKPYINVAASGISLEPIGWETTLKREGPISGAHQKATVIGQNLVREVPLREITDLFFRDIDIRGSTIIFISKGEAAQTLETKEAGVIPAIRLVQIAEQELTTRTLRHISLMKIWGKSNSQTSFLLQLIDVKKGEPEFNGAAVIQGKTNKMIGTLNKEEVEGINWITGEGKSGAVKAFQKKSDKPTYYQISSMKSKIKPHVTGKNISFEVKIESEGRIAEYWNPHFKPAFKNKTLKHIEKAAEKEVLYLVENTTEKIQKKYQVDVAGFGNELRIKYPDVWKKVKNNWDEEFSKVPISYDINITIKDYGMIGSNKNK
ncbi:Ger(x)C family spore germination protein [Neobacillus pocheonensis]|uniref:Ger(x)C family spore germination protein n=1 Tax=Neobacillus pocheonensis TaxID=363869 RepID=UPI003D2A1092